MNNVKEKSGLTNCHEKFQKYINSLAAKSSKTADEIYFLWKKYSNDCKNYDQSPVGFEFESWYKKELI